MIWLISRLRSDFRHWDRATQIAVVIGAVLLIGGLAAALSAPPEYRLRLLAGAGAVLLVVEAAVLWGNRGMIAPFTRAQRLYLAGDLDGAREVLEAARPRADARSLTLLGNTYRQLGQLEASAAILSEAVDKAPNHYFPHYGFGRTLLAMGHYADAVDAFRRAMEANAPPAVRADLGEAYYRLNMPEEARAALQAAVSPADDAARGLMVAYLLHRLNAAPPPAPELVRAGLPYWEAAAQRFEQTPYGMALKGDVQAMSALLEQGT